MLSDLSTTFEGMAIKGTKFYVAVEFHREPACVLYCSHILPLGDIFRGYVSMVTLMILTSAEPNVSAAIHSITACLDEQQDLRAYFHQGLF